MTFIGIDPGLSGAICVIDPSCIGFYEIDELQLVMAQYSMADARVAIEMQSMRKNQAGMGKMMKNYGILLGIIQCFGSDVTEVQAKKWYKHLGMKANLSYADRKKETASLMLEKYPLLKDQLYGPRGGLIDGRSDALAIATWLVETCT